MSEGSKVKYSIWEFRPVAIVYCAVRRNFSMMVGATAKNDLSGDRTITRCAGPVSNSFSSGQFWAVGICQDARVSMSPGLPRFVAEVIWRSTQLSRLELPFLRKGVHY